MELRPLGLGDREERVRVRLTLRMKGLSVVDGGGWMAAPGPLDVDGEDPAVL